MDSYDPHSCAEKQFEEIIKNLGHSELVALLVAFEVRLGTACERPHDLPRACAVAHRINNLLAVERLSRELEEPRPNSESLGS